MTKGEEGERREVRRNRDCSGMDMIEKGHAIASGLAMETIRGRKEGKRCSKDLDRHLLIESPYEVKDPAKKSVGEVRSPPRND